MTLFIDGTPMDDPAGRWAVSADSHLRQPPPLIVNDLSIPGVHGVLPVPSPTFAGATCTVVFDLEGDNYGQLLANFNALHRMFGPRRRLRTLTDQPPAVVGGGGGGTAPDTLGLDTDGVPYYAGAAGIDGLNFDADGVPYYADVGSLVVALDTDGVPYYSNPAAVSAYSYDAYTAQVQYVSVSELDILTSDTDARVTFTLSIPRGFWQDANPATVGLGNTSGLFTPPALQGGSAPIVDPVFVAVGAGATDFRVTDSETGTWLRFVGSVPAGQSVRVEPDIQSAFLVPSGSPWSGGTDVSGYLTLGPGQFQLSPDIAFSVAKTGLTDTQVRARRAYL